MVEDSGAQSVDLSLVAEIVASYFTRNRVGVGEIADLIVTVHQTLTGLSTNTAALAPAPEKLIPAVSIRRSLQPDHVVCLECGFRAQILRRHLRAAHGLDPTSYRVRWSLSPAHPLIAPTYSAQRSALAKQLGLGRKPA